MEQLADEKNQNSTNDVPLPSNSSENLRAEETLYHKGTVVTCEEQKQSESMEVGDPKIEDLIENKFFDGESRKQDDQSIVAEAISSGNIDSERQIGSSMTIETILVEEIREEIVRVMLASPRSTGEAVFTQASVHPIQTVPHDSISPSSSFISESIQKEMSQITDNEVEENTSCSFQNSSNLSICNSVSNHQLEVSPSVSDFFEEHAQVPENSEQTTSAIDPEDFFLQCDAHRQDDFGTELQLTDGTQDTDSSSQSSTSIISTVSAVCLSERRPTTNYDGKLNHNQFLSFGSRSDETNSIVLKDCPSSLTEEAYEFPKDVSVTSHPKELLKITYGNEKSKTEIDSSEPLSKCQNLSLSAATSNDLTSIDLETNQKQNCSSTLMLSRGDSSEHVEVSDVCQNNKTSSDDNSESASYIVSSVLKAVLGTFTSISEDLGEIREEDIKTSDDKCPLEDIIHSELEREINEKFACVENDSSCNMTKLVETTNETEDASSGIKCQSEEEKDSNEIETKPRECEILADSKTESKGNEYSVSDNQSDLHEIPLLSESVESAHDKNEVYQLNHITSDGDRTNNVDILSNSESVEDEKKECNDLVENEKLESAGTVNESIDSENKIEQGLASHASSMEQVEYDQQQKKPDQLIEEISEPANKSTVDTIPLQYAVLEEQLKKYYEEQLEQLRSAVKQKENTIVLLQRENTILEKEKAAFRCERDSAIKAKENIVITFATQEKSVIDIKKEKEKLEKQLLEAKREVKALTAKCNAVSEDKSRLTYVLDEKCNEAKRLQNEIHKHKSDNNHLESKLRSYLSKLNQESAAKIALEKKLEEERNSQSRLEEKAYENLKVEFEAKCILQKHQNEQNEQIIDGLTCELKRAENKLKSTLDELNTEKDLKSKLTLEFESVQTQLHFAQNIQSMEMLNSAKLRSQLDEMQVLKTQNTINEEKIAELLAKTTELEQKLMDSVEDLQALHAKEAELLAISKEMSESIVQLQNEICLLRSKVQAMHAESSLLKKEKSELSKKSKNLESQIKAEVQQRLDERVLFTKHLSERTKMYETVAARYENSLGELEANKKKHAKVLKENKRELEKLRKLKELEIQGTKLSSTSSRSSKNGKPTDNGRASETSSESQPNFNSDESPTKQHLIERILRLQKSSARQAEKIDFLENHSLSLVSELQKKSRVIQHYMVREQAGALTTSKSDENKKQLAKYGNGVMAAIYSGITGSNQGMTLELSLEINKKLQAVLEDTLLKNITLKENLDVLGLEVDKLTRKSS